MRLFLAFLLVIIFPLAAAFANEDLAFQNLSSTEIDELDKEEVTLRIIDGFSGEPIINIGMVFSISDLNQVQCIQAPCPSDEKEISQKAISDKNGFVKIKKFFLNGTEWSEASSLWFMGSKYDQAPIKFFNKKSQSPNKGISVLDADNLLSKKKQIENIEYYEVPVGYKDDNFDFTAVFDRVSGKPIANTEYKILPSERIRKDPRSYPKGNNFECNKYQEKLGKTGPYGHTKIFNIADIYYCGKILKIEGYEEVYIGQVLHNKKIMLLPTSISRTLKSILFLD